MSLFDDHPRAIEAAVAVIPAFDSTSEDVREGLNAALAALDREALIETMAAHFAMCDTFQQGREHYRHHAAKSLADIGLIPDPRSEGTT